MAKRHLELASRLKCDIAGDFGEQIVQKLLGMCVFPALKRLKLED